MPEQELDQQSENFVDSDYDEITDGSEAQESDPVIDDDGYSETVDGDDSPEGDSDKDNYTREEFEELKQRLELAEGLVDWDKVANAKVEEPATTEDAIQSIEAALSPKQFTYTEDEIQDILIEGNGDSLIGLLQRQAEVIQHNTKLETMRLMDQMLVSRLPVAVAANSFFERHPELSGPKGEELVDKVLDQVWAKNPRQSSAQLLRAAEKQLSSVITRAKEIAKNGGQRHNLAAREAGGRPLGTAPQPRRSPSQQFNNRATLADIGYDV